MDATVLIAPAQMLYMNIPAKELRNFVDGMFPSVAVNIIADSVRGFDHRYFAGHDLFLDIPKTFASHGFKEGLLHAGHVLLTDFPTKAGIPIPLFSHSGLGHLLENAGIHRGWLQVSLFDSTVGIMAISESASDLLQAIHGSLMMNYGTFFDTFVEGSITVGFGVAASNPLLVIAGVQELLAGCVAVYNKLSVYVDPLELFGSAGISALIGFGVAYGIAGENLSDASKNGIRSGSIGALFKISSAFGFGALAGFTSYRIGRALAHKHNESMNSCFSLNRETYQLLVDELCKGNLPVQKLLDIALPKTVLMGDMHILPSQLHLLKPNANLLHDNVTTMQSHVPTLHSGATVLKTSVKSLRDDPKVLGGCYKELTQ
ncbi:MAG: hypothetical protein JKY55_14025 [Aliivibrio sp.]|uniref:hypothetical protein n=1 Tax=Aliivibrio sp. TaxID=1872443 RepID=UPI001A4A6F5B|nr:hypothetical protein [Aliivibrio sp.]